MEPVQKKLGLQKRRDVLSTCFSTTISLSSLFYIIIFIFCCLSLQ